MRKKQWENGRGVAEGDTNEDSFVPFPAAGGTCCGGQVEEPDAGDVIAEQVRGVAGLIGGLLRIGDEAGEGVQGQEADEDEGIPDDVPFERLAGLEAMGQDWGGRAGQAPVHVGFGHALSLVLRAVSCRTLKAVKEEEEVGGGAGGQRVLCCANAVSGAPVGGKERTISQGFAWRCSCIFTSCFECDSRNFNLPSCAIPIIGHLPRHFRKYTIHRRLITIGSLD